jgi:hypothetical protein
MSRLKLNWSVIWLFPWAFVEVMDSSPAMDEN